MKTFDPDIVSGSVMRSVWKIAWPIVLTQVISGLHGFVDQILVGRYVGAEGNAGVGVAWQLFLVVLVFVSSLFHGMSIVMARYAGKKDVAAVSKVAYQAILASTYVLLLFVIPVGYMLAPRALVWVNTAPEVMPHAIAYLRSCFVFSAPLFYMFLLGGAFTATGDTKTPMKLAALTTAVNIGLSYVFVVGMGPVPSMGAAGAAIGTCFGPLPSVIIAVALILRRQTVMEPPERYTLVPDFSVVRVILRIGIPSGVQAVLLNVGGAILYGFIGSLELSAASQAAYSIAYGQLFSFVTWTGFGLRAATATVMGQNLGAGETERGVRCVYLSAALGVGWAGLLGLAYWFMPLTLLSWFNVADEQVIAIGTNLLRYLSFSGVLVLVALAFTGGLQGAGDTKRPMLIAFMSQIVILLGICAVFQAQGKLTSEVIWTAIFVAHASRLIMSVIVFRIGRWRQISVAID